MAIAQNHHTARAMRYLAFTVLQLHGDVERIFLMVAGRLDLPEVHLPVQLYDRYGHPWVLQVHHQSQKEL